MKKILPLLLLLVACSQDPQVPENMLQPKKMEAIMLDLVNADGFIANAPVSDSVLKRPESRYRIYRQIFSLHGTDKENFTRSLKYYEEHPALLKGVLQDMDGILTKAANDTAKKPIPKTTPGQKLDKIRSKLAK